MFLNRACNAYLVRAPFAFPWLAFPSGKGQNYNNTCSTPKGRNFRKFFIFAEDVKTIPCVLVKISKSVAGPADASPFPGIFNAHGLPALTGGIHLHTVACPDQGTLDRVLAALKSAGFLLEM